MQRLAVNIQTKTNQFAPSWHYSGKGKKEKEKEDGTGQHFLYNEQRKRKSQL